MLKLLRKKGVSKKILWVLAVVIIISFGFFGTAYLVDNSSFNYAGKIFGRKISLDAFQESYLHTRNQAILRYGEEFYKIEPFLNLEAETWDRLILLKEARRRGIRVSDEEVIETIAQYPFFQRNDRFDKLLYHDVLRYVLRSSPRDFEEGIRGTIAFMKLYQQAASGVSVAEEELFEEYQRQNAKLQVSYVLFSPEDYKKEAVVDEKEIREYYEGHKTFFIMPLLINVEYLKIPAPEDKTAAEKDQQESQIRQMAEELKTASPAGPSADLKTVGEKYGITVQESGLFSQEQPNLKIGWSYELLKKAFEMEQGQISEALETTEGTYILKIKEKHPPHMAEFQEIREKIKEALLLEKAKALAQNKASEYLKALKENLADTPQKDFTQTASPLNRPVLKTPLFHRGEYLPGLGISKEFQDAAFRLDTQNKISEVVETSRGFAILHLDSLQPVSQEDFEKEKAQFAKTLFQEKQNEAFNDFLSALRIKANLEDNISKLKAQRERQ